jgi:hypothetical protein
MVFILSSWLDLVFSTLLWLHHIELPIAQPQMQVPTQILTNPNAVHHIEITIIIIYGFCVDQIPPNHFMSYHDQ